MNLSQLIRESFPIPDDFITPTTSEVRMAKKTPEAKKSPLESAIASRERGIQRMVDRKKSIRDDAERQCVEIDKHIAEKRVLLDALKRGAL